MSGRKGIGFDIDPLALKISKVKTTAVNENVLLNQYKNIVNNAQNQVQNEKNKLEQILLTKWDSKSKLFVDYWFENEVQLELLALAIQISKIKNERIKTFFELALSAIIITKSGGVSNALDLAHTRPHKAKIVLSKEGKIISGGNLDENSNPRFKILTKKLRSPIEDFERRCIQNIKGLVKVDTDKVIPDIRFGNSQNVPISNEYIDLIVTSPPYASNAIDYMRAHKFSLIWLDYSIEKLSFKRKEYIGGEVVTNIMYENLPNFSSSIVTKISNLDSKRGKVLHRYFSEMTRTLREMYRVLKKGKTAIVVVGSSIMRGEDTQTQHCLADIGRNIGFVIPKIGVRRLDRNKRMLPASSNIDKKSQIQQRMHEEYIIGFYKPFK